VVMALSKFMVLVSWLIGDWAMIVEGSDKFAAIAGDVLGLKIAEIINKPQKNSTTEKIIKTSFINETSINLSLGINDDLKLSPTLIF